MRNVRSEALYRLRKSLADEGGTLNVENPGWGPGLSNFCLDWIRI
jgi:hypothetical protein